MKPARRCDERSLLGSHSENNNSGSGNGNGYDIRQRLKNLSRWFKMGVLFIIEYILLNKIFGIFLHLSIITRNKRDMSEANKLDKGRISVRSNLMYSHGNYELEWQTRWKLELLSNKTVDKKWIFIDESKIQIEINKDIEENKFASYAPQ